ncbi:MAG: YggS family pyridoxal phosphate-dependent enzyme [Lachnospiraceae bacterium]|nr:YggS family pyridoxal phosphate-dependent enzyme [Lachnospiraceae bacterium]
MIGDRIAEVKEQIRLRCEKSNRDPSEVTLIAVSKTKPLSMITEAMESGQAEFGENKVQEMCEKAAQLDGQPVHWHLIGHLQSNKVKKAVSVAELIHSVDSLSLAQEIDKYAAKAGKCQDILLEVNVADEESKFGLKPDEVIPLVKEIAGLKNLRLRGLMTVAPYTDDAETNRPYFRALHDLMVDINKKNIDNISVDILSMGMSGDYGVAVEEGATHVRVGTYLFGERDYSK